jgi:hypothetical protein
MSYLVVFRSVDLKSDSLYSVQTVTVYIGTTDVTSSAVTFLVPVWSRSGTTSI